MMKILVFGGEGQLGSDIVSEAMRMGIEAVAMSRGQCDITSEDQLDDLFRSESFHGVINAAAYTKVDLAEEERDLARAVNCTGAEHVSRQCSAMQLPLLHVSTDYVFDGRSSIPYSENEDPSPRSVYGHTKALGESAVLSAHTGAAVVRTSWLFGEHGPNFVKTMVQLAMSRDSLKVVDDQIGCPTWSKDLAVALLAMMKETVNGHKRTAGIYHYCGSTAVSWYDLAAIAIEEASTIEAVQLKALHRIPTSEYPTPAERPMYSVLDCSKIKHEFGIEQGDWRKGVREVVRSYLSLKR